VASIPLQVECQGMDPSLPFVVPAAFVSAAWAAQPDGLVASVGVVARQLAQVLGWMPPGLDEVVLRMC
jgi:hypothetical protein